MIVENVSACPLGPLQQLMTRAQRERLATARLPAPRDYARVRVRFPEGVSLQVRASEREGVCHVSRSPGTDSFTLHIARASLACTSPRPRC